MFQKGRQSFKLLHAVASCKDNDHDDKNSINNINVLMAVVVVVVVVPIIVQTFINCVSVHLAVS
jgi:hypothetical protein